MSHRIVETVVEPNDGLTQLVDELGDTMSLVRKPECLVLNTSIGPALRGFLKPQLLIPQQVLETCNAEELRLIVLHELVHVRRRDVLAGYFQSFVQILWWFHPAVWFAGRMASLERERCCDDEVLEASQSTGSVYARCLLTAAQISSHQQWAPYVVGLSGMTVLRRRMRHIMDEARQQTPNWVVVGSAALLAILVLPGEIPVAAVVDETSLQTSAESSEKGDQPFVFVPKLLAMTWVESTERDPSKGDLPLWKADGTELTDAEAKALRAEIGDTELVPWKPETETRPLVVVLDSGPDLPIDSVVRTTLRLPSGRLPHSGSSFGVRKGRQDPDLRFALSANTIAFRGEQPKGGRIASTFCSSIPSSSRKS